jgi:hypothetical protein
VLLPVLLKSILQIANFQKYTWIIVYVLGFSSFVMEFLTEDETIVKDALEVLKLIAVGLLIVDELSLWNSADGQNRQPALMLPIWFAAFFCCWLWGLSSYLYHQLGSIMTELSIFFLYGALLLNRSTRIDYQLIP